MKYYTKKHFWVEIDDDVAIFGLSEFAIHELGDITMIEMPEIGEFYSMNDVLSSLESITKSKKIIMPLSGEIIELNEDLGENPEIISESAEEEGWIAKIALEDKKEVKRLMSEDEYNAYVKDL
jgi:glycine cleavage system H protein